MTTKLRCLLLQVRNPDDPMLGHEVGAFSRVLGIEREQIATFDLLTRTLTNADLQAVDLVLLGGSGHYSVVRGGPFLEPALDALRRVCDSGVPTFASCWGFQAMARAQGGTVTHDLTRAELGTHRVHLTEAGRADPVFGPSGPTFRAQMGHEDHVVMLPPGATLLAYSTPANFPEHNLQAYRFDERPVYCTQFHPELAAADIRLRVRAYPEYVRKIAGLSLEEFDNLLHETPETEEVLRRFVTVYV